MAETPDTGEQTPDASGASSEAVGLPVLKTLVAAIAIIGLTTGAFWLIGDTGDDEIIVAGDTDDADEADDADDVEDADDPEPDPEPDEVEGDEPDDSGGEPDDVDEPAEADDVDANGDEEVDADGANGDENADEGQDANGDSEEADDEPAPDDDAGSEQDEAPDDSDEVDESQADPDAVDPATVSVQVLDGYQDDGGAAAEQIAGNIEGAGYNVVARNVALRSEPTSVLYNPGNEAAAQQLAAEINAADVRPQPGSLSTDVDVHVVVGFGGR